MNIHSKNNLLIIALKVLFFLSFTSLNAHANTKTKCSVALVLALDISGSVDWPEFRLQRSGIVNAFHDEEVIDMISFLPGGISVSVIYWSHEKHSKVAVDWTPLRTKSEVESFTQELKDYVILRSGPLTSIGDALSHANRHFTTNPSQCYRRVIDISSDGKNNNGPEPHRIADEISAQAITINALLITGEDETLVPYFRQNVIRGVGSFIQTTNEYKDYAHAMKRKLLRELAPVSAKLETQKHVILR